ncbi:MAG TPA: DUF1326 domain-containing protein [Vicinamibacterales bacterium]|nr:DUF1326 domain-containing protein [Vicinamibacterales bacterium]
MNATRTPWRIAGEETVTCNCAWGCPCQFNAPPTHGRCEALVAMRIREGHYGATKLDGLTYAQAYWWPGAIHEGNGITQMVIDERATPDQRTALLNITSGKEGCTLFEIFSAVVSKSLDPIYAPIELVSDRERRTAQVKVPGLGEFRIEPIKNPVTGEEHRAIIKLPNGFEYKEAEMGNCLENYAKLGDKIISNRNTYAQFAAVDWSNA